MNAIREESELPNIEKKLIECSDDITELFNMLMTLEMQLVEQLEVEPDWHRRRGLSMQLQSLTSMLSQALPLYVQCNPSGRAGEDWAGRDRWVSRAPWPIV